MDRTKHTCLQVVLNLLKLNWRCIFISKIYFFRCRLQILSLKGRYTMTEARNFYSSYIALCVLNGFLCCTAIILNSITIHAIRKTSYCS